MRRAASWRARISAWPVGSVRRSRSFPAAPSTSSSRTTTAPMGTSPHDRQRRACSRARSMYRWSGEGSLASMTNSILMERANSVRPGSASEQRNLVLAGVHPAAGDAASHDVREREHDEDCPDQRESDPGPQVYGVDE